MSLQPLVQQLAIWHSQGLKVVLATGVFDLLHLEHLRFLTKAKAAGDKLIVGLETDARVRRIKGSHRPVNSAKIRLEQLRALAAVDLAFVLPQQFSRQEDWINFMTALKPDLYAVSSHTAHLANKRLICRRLGITCRVVHRFNPTVSTSLLLRSLS